MGATPIRILFHVDDISTQLSSTGTAFVNPPVYLWSVFFKIDGSTVQVNAESANLEGTATVVSTPGDQGDLPGGVQASYDKVETTVIPSSLGDYATTLVPFSVPALSGFTVGGMIVGWLGILLYQQNTPANAVAAGHQALNNGVQQALNNAIKTITNNQTITPASVAAVEGQIRSQVTTAIKNALSFWDKLATFLNTEFQDTFVGLAPLLFTDSQLLASPAQGIPINYSISWGGTQDPQLYVFTFNGAVVANFPPFSLVRVLTGLGRTLPAGMRAAMSDAANPSVLGWIKAVTS